MAEHYQRPTVEDEEELRDDVISDKEILAEAPPEGVLIPTTDDTGENSTIRELKWEGLDDKQTIVFKDATGRKFNFPFSICKTWHGMEELIQQAMVHVEIFGDHVKAGHFDLLGLDGSVILPSVWEQCVKPGWYVTMRMWKDAEDDKKKGEKAAKGPIRFKDAVGRKFIWPFSQCQTWTGMEELIKLAFLTVDVIGPHVQAGHYDLLGPDQDIILPQLWDKVIQPDWAITMVMWPMERPRPADPRSGIPQHRPTGPPGGIPQHRPDGHSYGMPPHPGVRPGAMRNAGFRPAEYRPMAGGTPPPPPGGAYSGPHPDIAPDARLDEGVKKHKHYHEQEKSGKPSGGGFTSFLFGRPIKKKMSSKKKMKPQSIIETSSDSEASEEVVDLPLARRDTPPGNVHTALPPQWDVNVVKQALKQNGNHTASPSAKSNSSRSSLLAISRKSPHMRNGASDSHETDSFGNKARQEAKEKDLIVICRHTTGLRSTRQQTFTPTPRIVSTRLDIDSARVYWQGPSTTTLAMLELVRARALGPPTDSETQAKQDNPTQMRWIHAVRPSLSPNEFEHIALDQLCHDRPSRLLVAHLMDILRNKRRDDEWMIKPGTILRCNTDIREGQFEFVCFASVPTLHSNSMGAFNVPSTRAFYQEQKLHEALDQLHMDPGVDSTWPLRSEVETGTNHTFWVRQSWIMITSAGVLTYSSHEREVLRSTNISIQESFLQGDDGEQMIEVMDEIRRLFFLPAKNSKSFYELEIAAREALNRAGESDLGDTELQFELTDGEILTAAKWAKHVVKGEFPSLRISVKPCVEKSDSRQSDTVTMHSDTGESSDSDELSDIYSTSSRKPSWKSTNVKSSQGSGSSATKTDEKGFILLSSESILNIPYLGLPELNKKVPPFLSWLSAGQPQGFRGFREGIIRTELKLARREGHSFTESPVKDLFKTLDDTDIYHETAEMDVDEFELYRNNLHKGQRNQSDGTTTNLSAEDLLGMADEYFDASLRVLESFVVTQFKCTLVAKYLYALASIMKDPTRSLHREEAERSADDPELSDTPGQHDQTTWVISRMRTQADRIKYRSPAGDEGKCKDCDRGVVYNSIDEATTHLHQCHLVDSTPEVRIRYYVVPVASALFERRQEDQYDFLKASRSAMAAILQKLVDIQDGVVYKNEFREQRGLPYPFIESFRWIVIYVCAVPHIFHQISWFYNDDLPQHKRPKHLTSFKIRRQVKLLSKVRLEAEAQIRQAERALMSPSTFTTEELPKGVLVSVGPHYLASQIICNLLKMPVLNQKHASDLCEADANNLKSQVLRRPSKRQILKIGALNDDLDLIVKFYDWQKETLHRFDLIIDPATYPRVDRAHEERKKLFDLEVEIVLSQDLRLDKDLRRIYKTLELCDRLIKQIHKRTEIMKEDQSQVIFIFTIVTVVFLPLSFVASYVSMSGGTTGLDWSGIQVLFWSVASPLTAAVIIFCLMVAKRRRLVRALTATRWMKRVLEWMSDKLVVASRCWNRLTGRLTGGRRHHGNASDESPDMTTANATSSSTSVSLM